MHEALRGHPHECSDRSVPQGCIFRLSCSQERAHALPWWRSNRWEPNSYGYHGDDGKKFHANGGGEDYGPLFTTGDIVGAGIHIQRQEIFFT